MLLFEIGSKSHRAQLSRCSKLAKGQKRAEMSFSIKLVQNSVRNYELLEITVFCQKREESNNLKKYSHCVTSSLREKQRITVNTPKLLCGVIISSEL